MKKDPGIPNLFPYKDKILQEIEANRERKREEAERRRELAKAARTGGGTEAANTEGQTAGSVAEDDHDDPEMMDEDEDIDESNPMAALLASAKAAAKTFNRENGIEDADMDSDDDDEDMDEDSDEFGGFNDEDSDDGGRGKERLLSTSRRAYDKVFREVVERADVVLYVLDARDPEGTRSRDVEQAVLASAAGSGSDGGKRLIFVLNKIDLVPGDVLKGWLTHLRRSFPTLPFRASGSGAATFDHRGPLTAQNTAATLFRALKAYAASAGLRRSVSVGVVGYPNVGKSSVINALLSRLSGGHGSSKSACPTGAEAGVTTSIRSVKIDGKLTLLDSPGIVFPSSSADGAAGVPAPSKKSAEAAHARLVLLNALPPRDIVDPVPAVTLLLSRLRAMDAASGNSLLMDRLASLYDLPPLLASPSEDGNGDGDVTTDFLVQVARRRGRLGRGGIPNLHAAASTVVADWRDGRIQGWVRPPVATSESVSRGSASASAADEKVIVTEWAKEFKLEGLWGDDEEGAPVGEVVQE